MRAVEAAVAAVERGWAIFPLRPGSKLPAVGRWEERATNNVAAVERYWHEHPRANVGIACGPSRLLVVDLDQKGGRDGVTAFVLSVIPFPHALPETFTVETPSGGLHLYFRTREGDDYRNTSGRLGAGVDTRGVGGFVVAAGSVVDGVPYDVVVGVAPIVVPRWLEQRLVVPAQTSERMARLHDSNSDRYSSSARVDGLVQAVAVAEPGRRNNMLNWAAHKLGQAVASERISDDEVAMSLADLANVAEAVGLTSKEIAATIASGFRSGLRP
jgi:hypothetical protein